MNKLQLYITISSGEFRHMYEINPDAAVRSKVVDLTEAVEDVTYDQSAICIFYVLKSTDQGTFLVVIRTIPNKPKHHLAAWIFIPYDISLADSEIMGIADQVAAIVTNSRVNEDHIATLTEIFSKEYPTQPDAGATVENQGRTYAHRFYGGYTGNFLSDLIGNKRYQTSYLPYCGVIVADRSKVTEIIGINLTDEPLEPMVRVLPPASESPGYRPIIFGQLFDKPFLAPLMSTIEIVWESSSDVDVRQSIMVSRPDMRVEPVTASAQRAQKSAPAIPAIPAETGADTDTEATVEEPLKTPADGRPVGKNAPKVYNFEIPSKSASISGMIKFSITSRSELDESPIDGYDLTDDIQEGAAHTNHLVYTPGNSLQNNALWALTGFVIGILLTLLCTCGKTSGTSAGSGSPDATADSIAAVADTAAVAPRPVDTSLEGAIYYLDHNQTWTLEELEAYPDLQGLYHDLNTINRASLTDKWEPRLKESRSFAKIMEHVKNGHKKKPRLKAGQTTFNTPDDHKISVRSYLNCIDP